MIGKMLNSGDDHGVGLLAAGNLGINSIAAWLTQIEPMLRVLLSVGQIGVAAVTIYYIYRKARQVGARRKRR